MNFRYYTGRALRKQNHPFGEFEGTEIRSEEFDSLEDFLADCIEKEMQLIQDELEGQDENDEPDLD